MDKEDLTRMNRVLRHRLRNVASGMSNALSLLEHELEARLQPAEREYFPLLKEECDGLRRLTDRFNLLFDDLPPGYPVCLGDAVNTVIMQVRGDFPSVMIMQENEQDWTEIRLESGQWFRVILLEIVGNAAQCAPTGTVNISAERRDERLLVRVRDEGPGLKPETEQQMFKPFYTTFPRRLGVGLAIARRWAERSGGEVRPVVLAGAPGTCMEIELPADAGKCGSE